MNFTTIENLRKLGRLSVLAAENKPPNWYTCMTIVLDCLDEMVNALSGELYALKPITRMQLGLFVAEPGELPPDLAALFASFDAERVQTLLSYLYNVSARQFHDPAHRMNVMRGFLQRATHRFGEDVVPHMVAERLGFSTVA